MKKIAQLLNNPAISERVDTVWQTISKDFERSYQVLPVKYMKRSELSFHPYVKLLGFLCLDTTDLPGDVVEIGVWKGKSLAFMNALSPPTKNLIGIDPCYLPGQQEELTYFHQQLFPACHLIRAPSEDALDAVKKLSSRISILHIDGDHRAEAVISR